MSDPFDTMIGPLLQREGGYVCDDRDPGAATNFGVTEEVARANGYTGPMTAMTRDQAKAIYRARYWSGPGFDQVGALSAAIGEELFDTGVNMGPTVAAIFLQRALNALNGAATRPDLKLDGNLGPMTLATLKAFLARRGAAGVSILLTALNALQGARYIEIAEARVASRAFTFGWLSQRVSLKG